MAGHSQFKNIMHRKGAQDARKGKMFTKLIKEISVAVKEGGLPDPDSNPRLRTAIQNARGVNMPKDVIERAIKKASGAGGDNFSEGTFEGYGPDGVAVFVEVATDNNTRTVANIRSYFTKHGGTLGKEGCLEFIFARKGIFTIEAQGLNEDDFTMDLIDAGAEDVVFEDGIVTVTSAMESFGSIQKKLVELNVEPKESGLQRIPLNTKKIGQEAYQKFSRLVEVLEDDDDVLKVYHNLEFEEYMTKMSE